MEHLQTDRRGPSPERFGFAGLARGQPDDGSDEPPTDDDAPPAPDDESKTDDDVAVGTDRRRMG